MSASIGIGLIGIGGYAQNHIQALRPVQMYGLCRVIAAADPFAEQRPQLSNPLKAEGVTLYAEPEPLLARDDINAVVITTPIHLHAPQAIAALEAGKHVYLEKPPCATLGEFQRLRAAHEKSDRICLVGFQFQTNPALRYLKRQIQEGKLGTLQSVWTAVRWPRDDSYYNRSSWAGRWIVDGNPVFDGPATNALSHVVQAAVFLAGETENAPAQLRRIRGSLKKARPIESYDTAYIEAETTSGVQVRLAFTHASDWSDDAALFCRGTQGHASLNWSGNLQLHLQDEPAQPFSFAQIDRAATILDFLRAVETARRNEVPAPTLIPTLEESLPYMQLVNGALQSSHGSSFFAEDTISQVAPDTPQRRFKVAGLDEAMEALAGDPDAVSPIFGVESNSWVEPRELSPQLTI